MTAMMMMMMMVMMLMLMMMLMMIMRMLTVLRAPSGGQEGALGNLQTELAASGADQGRGSKQTTRAAGKPNKRADRGHDFLLPHTAYRTYDMPRVYDMVFRVVNPGTI